MEAMIIDTVVPLLFALGVVAVLVLTSFLLSAPKVRTLRKEAFCPTRKRFFRVVFALDPIRNKPHCVDVVACSAFARGQAIRCSRSCVKNANHAQEEPADKHPVAA